MKKVLKPRDQVVLKLICNQQRVCLALMGNHDMKMGLDARNLSSVVYEQQRRRTAYASVQTDQRLCYSLF